MSLPTVAKTWNITPNNRITYVSLNDTMANYLYGVKAFLTSNGYTVKGSCDGTTGNAALGGVDYWSNATKCTTRSSTASGLTGTSMQSWIILTDGNAVDILITYLGATDDVCSISYSPTQAFALAAFPYQKPTATDEQTIGAATRIGTTASGDRIWHGWVSSDRKACRFTTFSTGAAISGSMWFLEAVTSSVTGSGAVFSPAVVGATGTSNGLVVGAGLGVARTVIASVAKNCTVLLGVEYTNGGAAFWNTASVLQGPGYTILPLSAWTATAGSPGKLGNMIDMWATGTAAGVAGDTYGTLQFIQVPGFTGSLAGGVWPWNGSTNPMIT